MTERIVIDKQRALDLLDLAVQAKGADHTDPHCAYSAVAFDPGPARIPACIIGHALSLAGVPVETLYALDNYSIAVETTEVPDLASSGVLAENGIDLDTDALRAFTVAQREQDKLRTWGEAVEIARAAVAGE